MATKSKNPAWAFFSSVKLALFLIGLLASTSIIGTVVQQNKSADHYIKTWGEKFSGLIQMLNLDDMYNSAWFLTLLGVFSLNLIICSLDRIPNVIRLVRKDNLTTNPDRLHKMKMRKIIHLDGSLDAGKQQVADFLSGKGWKTDSRDKEGGIMLFSQSGGWTRFGVYIVHVSILIILLGAVIGSAAVAKNILRNPGYAFKGSLSLPETEQNDKIYSFDDGSNIPLGFTVQCDYFNIDFYNNGMPKDYVSGLRVFDGGKEVINTIIEVNKPLRYKGVTFYQSSYNEMPNPIIKIKNKNTGEQHLFPVDPRQLDETFKWQEGEEQGMVRILSAKDVQSSRGGHTNLEIWFMDLKGPPSVFTLRYNTQAVVERPGVDYDFQVVPQYATGLQVSKDPGVWWVYTGCGLMLIGLFVAFFMSHRKVWAHVYKEEGQPKVIFAGSANKNKVGFEKTFDDLVDDFKEKEK